ncbi:hypothetical protein ACFQZ4_52125 [Catellatospora coxensis]
MAGLVAFGVRSRDLVRGLGADLRELALNAGGGQLGLERLDKCLGDLLEFLDDFVRLGDLPGEAGELRWRSRLFRAAAWQAPSLSRQ